MSPLLRTTTHAPCMHTGAPAWAVHERPSGCRRRGEREEQRPARRCHGEALHVISMVSVGGPSSSSERTLVRNWVVPHHPFAQPQWNQNENKPKEYGAPCTVASTQLRSRDCSCGWCVVLPSASWISMRMRMVHIGNQNFTMYKVG